MPSRETCLRLGAGEGFREGRQGEGRGVALLQTASNEKVCLVSLSNKLASLLGKFLVTEQDRNTYEN